MASATTGRSSTRPQFDHLMNVRANTWLARCPDSSRTREFVHCWVTDLPRSDDGIGVWEAGRILFVAGHNLFKQAPALGRALARAATGDRLRAELTPDARLGEPQQ